MHAPAPEGAALSEEEMERQPLKRLKVSMAPDLAKKVMCALPTARQEAAAQQLSQQSQQAEVDQIILAAPAALKASENAVKAAQSSACPPDKTSQEMVEPRDYVKQGSSDVVEQLDQKAIDEHYKSIKPSSSRPLHHHVSQVEFGFDSENARVKICELEQQAEQQRSNSVILCFLKEHLGDNVYETAPFYVVARQNGYQVWRGDSERTLIYKNINGELRPHGCTQEAVNAIVCKAGEVLMVKKDTCQEKNIGKWVLPGGVVPCGATYHDFIVEWIFREAGIRVRDSDFEHNWVSQRRDLNENGKYGFTKQPDVCTTFRLLCLNDASIVTGKAQWFAIEELQDMTIKQEVNARDVERIKRAMNGDKWFEEKRRRLIQQ